MKSKYNVGLTFGAFEILHYGHISLLERAKKLCETLVVCVSDDEYITRIKGHEPFVPFKERVRMIKALRCVDKVDIQSLNFSKKEAVEKYKPDVLFVGSDWGSQTYTGEGLGVEVVYLRRTPGISSTVLRERLVK